jgi:hypothetical protein
MKNPLSMRCKAIASVWLAVGCLTSGVVSTANANLILNGSFEDNSPTVLPGNGTIPNSWTFANANVGYLFHSDVPFTWSPYTAPGAEAGHQYELLQYFDTRLQQSFHVGTAGDYELTWSDNALYAGASAAPPMQYRVYVYDSLNNIVASATEGPYSGSTTWNARSLSMNLGTGNYVLSFQNDLFTSGSIGYYVTLDNVGLDAVTAVPEVSTITAGALLLLPLGASTLRILRKR